MDADKYGVRQKLFSQSPRMVGWNVLPQCVFQLWGRTFHYPGKKLLTDFVHSGFVSLLTSLISPFFFTIKLVTSTFGTTIMRFLGKIVEINTSLCMNFNFYYANRASCVFKKRALIFGVFIFILSVCCETTSESITQPLIFRNLTFIIPHTIPLTLEWHAHFLKYIWSASFYWVGCFVRSNRAKYGP